MATSVLALRQPAASRTRIPWAFPSSVTLFICLFALYFGVGCYLAMVANVIYDDTMYRSENAMRVLLSRDPHLGAIGFLWNPLPIIALLPLVPLHDLWPQMTALGVDGDIISAICMSIAVLQVRGMLSEIGSRSRINLLVSGAFALHPLVFFFGANGMTEAMLVMFLLIAVRYLARWLRTSSLNALVATGIALSFAYFTRYESLAGALGVITLVAVASYFRNRQEGRWLSVTVCDLAIVAAPVTLAFVAWAVANWLIVGHPFDRFASVYNFGLAAQAGPVPFRRTLVTGVLTQILFLEPLLPVILMLGLVARRPRHLSLVLASTACLGATLAFMVGTEITGSLANNELRYLIVTVPLAVVFAGISASNGSRSQTRGTRHGRAVTFACVACILAALPVSAGAMLDTGVDPIAAVYLQSMFAPSRGGDLGGRLNWTTSRQIARDLDRLNLPPGAVLLDDYEGGPIVVSSDNPKQFVITSDRDFQSILVDPIGGGVQYILVPVKDQLGSLDAVNRQYPGFFDNGGGFTTIVREYPKRGLNDTTWRLYRVNPAASQVNGH